MIAICKHPGCELEAVGRKRCRRHRAAFLRAEQSRMDARQDKSPPQEWSVMAFIGTHGGSVSRTMISRDPIRRRDEMQAGCPWPLVFSAVVFAPRSTLDAVQYELEVDLARLDEDAREMGLRPGWWPLSPAHVESIAVGVADMLAAKGIRRPVAPAALKKMEFDLIDPAQDRLMRLLDLLEQEKSQAR